MTGQGQPSRGEPQSTLNCPRRWQSTPNCPQPVHRGRTGTEQHQQLHHQCRRRHDHHHCAYARTATGQAGPEHHGQHRHRRGRNLAAQWLTTVIVITALGGGQTEHRRLRAMGGGRIGEAANPGPGQTISLDEALFGQEGPQQEMHEGIDSFLDGKVAWAAQCSPQQDHFYPDGAVRPGAWQASTAASAGPQGTESEDPVHQQPHQAVEARPGRWHDFDSADARDDREQPECESWDGGYCMPPPSEADVRNTYCPDWYIAGLQEPSGRMHMCAQVCTSVHKGAQVCTSVHKCAQVQVCTSVHKYAQVCTFVHKHRKCEAILYRNDHECMHNCARNYPA